MKLAALLGLLVVSKTAQSEQRELLAYEDYDQNYEYNEEDYDYDYSVDTNDDYDFDVDDYEYEYDYLDTSRAALKGNLVGTVDVKNNFAIDFDVTPLKKNPGWRTLVQVGNDGGRERFPGIWFHGNSFALHICVSGAGGSNNCINPPKALQKKKNYNIRVSCRKSKCAVSISGLNSNYRYSGVINCPGRKPANNKNVYALGSPWYHSAGVKIDEIRFSRVIRVPSKISGQSNGKWPTRKSSLSPWDGVVNFDSKYAITGVYSQHDNAREDRQWRFTEVKKVLGGRSALDRLEMTEMKRKWTRDCNANGQKNRAVTFVWSIHRNAHEDRVFQLGCRSFKGRAIKGCYWKGASILDQKMDSQCRVGEVMTGMRAAAWNPGARDRSYSTRCCQFVKL